MLTGDLIRLRPLEPSDAELMWRWNHDPEVGRWMFSSYPESLAQITRRFEDLPRNSYTSAFFGIELLNKRQLIGSVRLRDAEPETGAAELDLRIGDKEYWGRGYATDTVKVICRYGFAEMRLHRIRLSVVAENAAAIRVYEKVGFVVEGREREAFRRDGTWHDMVLMGLLEGELL
ncbi:GNAT family N-acetyltransferase [Nonomuraea angiospora]|uniref:GNAT family N-acetyltransferase n=1 Tax=Nonomuraea angiospora TaxID=46172 RepID=UPI003403F0B4